MTYFKATRPNGTDFFTGQMRWEVGATITHPTSTRYEDMRPNGPWTYLSASTVPAETLIGGSWPCKLFRVKPVGRTVKRTDGSLPHKRGATGWRVLEELPAWQALGPNGEHVAALIDRAGRLTPDEARALGAACGAAWGAAYGVAWGAAARASRDAAWGAVRDAVCDAARDAARDAAGDAAGAAVRDAFRDAVRRAACDAAGALIVRDVLSADHFDALYGPWRSVIG